MGAADIELVTLCAGTFEMGCTAGQAGCGPDESPTRTTTLTRAYALSRTELTEAQFEALLGQRPASFYGCEADCPAAGLSWHQGAALANAASAAEGLPACYACTGSGATTACTQALEPADCGGYRLPTEAEWEAAARCGEDLRYAGSDTVDAVAWTFQNSDQHSHPVGSLAPNACGLFDMSGNVAEWVNDWGLADYAEGEARDPTGPPSGVDRVRRGGSWSLDAPYARVSARGEDQPSFQHGDVGVRLMRPVP